MKLVNPKEFTIRLSECGTDTFRGSYKTLKEKDALRLALIVNRIMTNDFIDKTHQQLFDYHLACKLLKNVLVDNFNAESVLRDIKNADSFVGKWELKQDIKPKGEGSE